MIGRQFKVRSDHQPLKWIFKLREPTGQTARWLETLASYDFVIEYRPGSKHGNADSMSRRPCDPRKCDCPYSDEDLSCGPCKKCSKQIAHGLVPIARVSTRKPRNQPEIESPCLAEQYSKSQLREMQLKDPDIAPVLLWKEESEEKPIGRKVVSKSPATRNLWLCWDALEVQDGTLHKKWNSDKDTVYRLVVPRILQNEVIKNLHDPKLAGHFGQKKTLARVVQRFYWYQMKESVHNYIKCCAVCQANKRPVRRPKAPLGELTVGAPLDRVGVDLLGPLPVTPRGNKHLLVVQDYFTKWVEVYPVPDTTAETCADCIVNQFIARFGSPLSIHTDQGRNFEAELFQEVCNLLDVKKTRTSPRHPSCNGLVERFNSTLVKMIKAYLHGKQNEWDVNLGCLLGAYRSTIHPSTGYSPNKLMLGRETRMPIDIVFAQHKLDEQSISDYVVKVQDDIHDAYQKARCHLKQAALRQQDNYNVKMSLISYKPGDAVWFLDESRTPGKCFKLQNLWCGPCMITRKLSDLNYEIQISPRKQRRVVHHDKLKRFEGVLPNWCKTLVKSMQ